MLLCLHDQKFLVGLKGFIADFLALYHNELFDQTLKITHVVPVAKVPQYIVHNYVK